jgi:hypothetical protein
VCYWVGEECDHFLLVCVRIIHSRYPTRHAEYSAISGEPSGHKSRRRDVFSGLLSVHFVTFRETPAGVQPAVRSLFYGGEYPGYP